MNYQLGIGSFDSCCFEPRIDSVDYVRRFLTGKRFPKLSSAQILSAQEKTMAELDELRFSGVELSNEYIDAILKAKELALDIMIRVGKDMIQRNHVWMIYDPCMTSKWRDAETAKRFQEFLRRRHADEKAVAHVRRHASADRRRVLVELHKSDEKGEVIAQVVNLFVDGLMEELTIAHGVRSQFLGGLFAKWCPTPGGMHDKALGIVPLIREKLLGRLREEENSGLRETLLSSIAQRIKKSHVPLEHVSLQRDILTPLRRLAEIPEHFIGTSRGQGANYNRMPSRCRYLFGQKVFRKHDQENYDRFLLDAAKSALLTKVQETGGKSAKVNASALAPHEVMLKAVNAHSPVDILEAELQWRALVESCAPFANRLIIPMCDVSGSMSCSCGGQSNVRCMDVAMALSLLLTDSLPESNPFHGKILTFSEDPVFVDVRPEKCNVLTVDSMNCANSIEEISALIPNLADRVRYLSGSPWGVSTDFFKAAEKICDVIEEHKLSPEDVEGLELVVFSDMEFNEARYGSDCDQTTMLQKIQQLFADRFEFAVHPPKIVFWNLRASISGSGVVQNAEEEGVALLSGLSSGLLRKYLSWDLEALPDSDAAVPERGGQSKMNPLKAMMTCLEDPLYETLRLEQDLVEWEVIFSEEEIMNRGEKVVGENGEVVHVSNSSALVAFFFEAVPSIKIGDLEDLLEAAFTENPKVALKLLFNLGTVRKNAAGKADRDNFQAALLWLFRKWPRTYLLNVGCIAKFASLKEVLNSAMYIMYEGQIEIDEGDYALFSFKGQKKSLEEHQMRKRRVRGRERRHKKKLNRLLLWADFARSEERTLFGDLRIKVEWITLKKKLRTQHSVGWRRSCKCTPEENLITLEDSWDMKQRLARERERSLAKKKKARSRKRQKAKNTTKQTNQKMNRLDTKPDFFVR